MCITNKLSRPPNYDLPEIRDDGKSVVSTAVKNEESFIMKPLEDFSSLGKHAIIPVKRGKGGIWLTDADFNGCFEYF